MSAVPTIPIGDARRIARERQQAMVVVFGIAEGGQRFEVTTYGCTRALCRLAASFADQIAAAVLDGTIGPPEFEPAELPDRPATFEGTKPA